MKTRRASVAVLLFASLGGAACTGVIGGDAPTQSAVAPDAGTTGVATTRFPRLSHAQWENTTRDLFHLDTPSGLSATFIPDPPGGDFDNDSTLLEVTPELWSDYQRAAEALAKKVARDPVALAKILPPGLPASGDARAQGFISGFGSHAFRRPLQPAEVASYLTLFNQGPTLIGGTDPFAAGAELVIDAMLQSPHFIYKIEAGSVPGPDGRIPLSGYEIATKLSYMFWNTMPSDALMTAAGAGELDTPAGVSKWVATLLADPRSGDAIASFHRQLFKVSNYPNIYKDPTRFPKFSKTAPASMQQENALFVKDAVIDHEGGLGALLSSTYTYVNADLAPLYGLTGSFDSNFKRVDLDPKRRAGVFTQSGFLALYGTAAASDPIHRGVYLNRLIICANLPNPPPNVPPLPPDDGSLTTRQRVDKHTGAGTCGATCHGTLINPIGFAFEHYDAVGAWRDTDNGQPVDSTATYTFDGNPVTYVDAVDLSAKMLASDQVQQCYAKNWLEFAYARPFAAGDQPLVASLAAQSKQGASVKQMLSALAQASEFTSRAKETP